MPVLRFHLLTIAHIMWNGTVTVTVTTNAACHLYLRYSDVFPRIHRKSVLRRGLVMGWDARYCFAAYQHLDQDEAGDTWTHTFTWPGWNDCETRYFYFWGTMGGQDMVSETPIFWLHYLTLIPDYLILRPTGVGDLSLHFQYPDTGEHWQKVDEEVGNQDANYVYSSTTTGVGYEDLYTIPDHGLPPHTLIIKLVFSGQFYIPYSHGFSGAAGFYLKTLGEDHAPSIDHLIYDSWYTTPSVDLPLNPVSELPWTLNDLTNLQIGTALSASFAFGPAKNSQLELHAHFISPG